MLIFKYLTDEEAEQIKLTQQAKGNVLVEIANITDGNFLGFREPIDPVPVAPIIPESTDDKLKELSEQNLILMDAVATLYEQFTINGGV